MEMTTEKWTADKTQSSSSAPELKELDMFTGNWKIDGMNMSDASAEAETPVSGEDKYSWMPGKHYLVNKWHHDFTGGTHTGISLLGYDPEKKEFFTHSFDNSGFERRYPMHRKGNKWTLTGKTERATIEFNESHNTFSQHWEVRKGEDWKPLCIMHGKKHKE